MSHKLNTGLIVLAILQSTLFLSWPNLRVYKLKRLNPILETKVSAASIAIPGDLAIIETEYSHNPDSLDAIFLMGTESFITISTLKGWTGTFEDQFVDSMSNIFKKKKDITNYYMYYFNMCGDSLIGFHYLLDRSMDYGMEGFILPKRKLFVSVYAEQINIERALVRLSEIIYTEADSTYWEYIDRY